MITNKIEELNQILTSKEKAVFEYELKTLKKDREVGIKIGNCYFLLKEEEKQKLKCLK